MDDLLNTFVIPSLGVRGAHVRLGSAYREALTHQPYPSSVQRWLGEALAAAALLTTGIKFQGRLSLQLQGAGDLRLLYAECTSEGDLRGIARFEPGESMALDDLCASAGAAVLAITLEPHQGRERYQGVVELAGSTLAETLEGYFQNSEQLPTRLLLAADGVNASGLLLQRLAGEGGHADQIDPDAWNRVQHLFASVGPQELIATEAALLLYRLFHDGDCLLADPKPIHLRCRCSRAKVADVLQRIGHSEALAATQDLGHAEITCEFCGKVYRFDPVEVEQLFHQAIPPPPASGQH